VDISQTHRKVQGLIVVTLLGVPMVAAFLIWLADGSARPGFADARIISVRYIASVLVFMLMMVPFFRLAASRATDAPLTWGEAMVAATYVFGVLFWLYGVVPHEFLNWADSELAWRPDAKVIGPEGSWGAWWGFWTSVPLTISKETIRDLVAVHIYTVGLGGFMWACGFWNKRQQVIDAAKAIEPVSRYGRPLVVKAGKA